jgi:predicted RNA-binding protein YlqC (UPF0109 family)
MEEELVRFIAENLVNDAEKVTLNTKKKGRTVVIALNVSPDDMGRVIGKSGRVANAIRALLRAATDQRRKRVILEIE